MPTRHSRPRAVLFSRSLVALLLLVALSPILRALPNDLLLKLDANYGLIPRPQGHQYFPSPQDWRDINIYQLFT
ncbi:MAG: hypothetical protein ACK56I_21135, partial [bacterium]